MKRAIRTTLGHRKAQRGNAQEKRELKLMTDSRVDLRRFHHVTIAVEDLALAVADWTERLGWQPSAASADRARFPLEDAYVELISAGSGGFAPGVVSVSVAVDNVAEVTDRLRAAGVSLSTSADGSTRVDPSAATGVPLELHAEEGPIDTPPAGGQSGPYRRINHVVGNDARLVVMISDAA